jgi:hypothetical protein
MLYILVESRTQDTRLKNHKTTGVGQAFATIQHTRKWVKVHKKAVTLGTNTLILQKLKMFVTK